MQRRRVLALALLVAIHTAINAWGAFSPFVVSDGPYHWSVTLSNAVQNFAFGLLWAGVLAVTYWRSPGGRMWKLILLYAVSNSTWAFGYVDHPVAWTIADFLTPLSAAVLLHLVLGFPDGRLRDRVDRALVGTVYAFVLPLQLLAFLFWDNGYNVLLLVPSDELYFAITRLGLLSPVLAALGIVETIRHWRDATPARRRSLAPVAVGMPLVFVIHGLWWLAPALDRDEIRQFILRSDLFDIPGFLTPALFFIGTVRTRLARGAVADLALEVGRGIPLGGLRDALARALRDPTLQVAFATPDGAGFVDPDGRPFDPSVGPGRATEAVTRDGSTIALLVHDPVIDEEDPGLVRAVGSVAGMALENERLQAQVRAQLEEVRASRQRIVEAGDTERRRVERDLHDGAQQRLVALVMRLEAARGTSADAQALIDATTAELGTAIAEVRSLARGLHPPILTEAGLRAAVESLAERTSVPVEVSADNRRYPAAIEATAYFVVAEALTNVARYAGATHARVTIRSTADALTVEVADDGAGGADADRGSGLRGLQDRVAAVRGRLEIESPPGAGTLLRADLPLVDRT